MSAEDHLLLPQPSDPYYQWNVWRTVRSLKKDGVSSIHQTRYAAIAEQVISILCRWGIKWAGQPEWQSILNKTSLQHEVEECIVALHYLHEWLCSAEGEPLTVVDMCCGKGIFSMLLAYMVDMDSNRCSRRIQNIVLFDKAADINYHHIEVASTELCSPKLVLWRGINLHDTDDLVERLSSFGTDIALIGIHLCKQLGPAAMSLANLLSPQYFMLAPCCLPRIVTSRVEQRRMLSIIQPESFEERRGRLFATKLRNAALGRDRRNVCYLCHKTNMHRVRDCPLLEGLSDTDSRDLLREATLKIPCWNCGIIGHYKNNCPSPPVKLVEPPKKLVDVSSVATCTDPYMQYCQLLSTEMNGTLNETGLSNKSHDDDTKKDGNWNSGRKSVFIVSTTKQAA